MLMSMTGYGQSTGPTGVGEIQVEIRGLNSRNLDLRIRTPRYLLALEPMLQKELRTRLGRGRVECNLKLDSSSAQTSSEIPISTDNLPGK